ncbi:MAG: uroporphyrinogen decarboxylase [Firmicutes bacterium]|nr:uroporphyrinogen decarboxylase [Alicyclobacillaceae bacterium]MCL6497806.1 uroporphyrinogen decarboxylase [Bacillota bacterium]
MNDRFLRACRGEPTDVTPVWFMRQAGRYQPEYRRLRARYRLLELARDPALCAEVTCGAVESLGVDAAILFSDIMVPLEPMGVAFDIREGTGPVVSAPIRRAADVERLRPLEPERHLRFVGEAIHRCRERLAVPLIGFAGGPFTLASYLVEGGPSRDYAATKRWMWTDPEGFQLLLERLSEAVAAFLAYQIREGAAAVQIFDSWVGALAPEDYAERVLPHLRRLVQAVRPLGAPIIYFGVGTATLLPWIRTLGVDVIGLDWRIPLGTARAQLGDQQAVQGNLDPAAVLAPWPVVAAKADAILAANGGRPGHIFNLGHGVLPETDPAILRRLVDWVHARPVGEGGRGAHG